MSERITPVLLCGGGGTRLWPISKAAWPKQLLALSGSGTMLQQTVLRTAGAEMFEEPVVISGREHADEIEAQLAQVGVEAAGLILEPCSRNTAAAVLLATLGAPADAVLLVMPSDHVIENIAEFREAVTAGLEAARTDWLVTFGITPTRAETGYGYIRVGAELKSGVYQAERFIEKPDRVRAEQFVRDGRHAWNAGIFLFRAGALAEVAKAAAPELVESVSAALAAQTTAGRRAYPEAEAFASAPSISIDHAVMEKAQRVAVVPFSGGWSDVGSWEALHEISHKDENGNALSGTVLALDATGCLIRSDGPPVVAIGIRDLVVVATLDGMLIVPRSESQRVREALALLKEAQTSAAPSQAATNLRPPSAAEKQPF